MSRALEIAAPAAHRDQPAHHSRTAAWLLAAALFAVGACGTVDAVPTAKDDAGGNDAAGAGGAAGGAGGAGGKIGGAGVAGHAGAHGTAGASSGGAGGAPPAAPSGPDPSKAPACLYAAQAGSEHEDCRTPDGGYVEVTINGGVPGSGVNSWRCRTGCQSSSGTPEPVQPCAGSNATYCVASCSDCY